MADAIKHKCKTCPYFHQPDPAAGGGACVLYPPVPLFMGMMPAGGPLVDPTKPPQINPMIRGSYPLMNEEEGCWQHPDAQREIMANRMKALN